MKSKVSKKGYTFVAIQLLLIIIYFLPVEIIVIFDNVWFQFFGVVLISVGIALGLIAVFQLNTNLSPFPIPVPKSKLIVNGAFSISRHPIYTATLIVTLGYAIYCHSLYKLIVFVFLGFLFYLKSEYEERLLVDEFPEYKGYKAKTRRFL